MTTRKIETIIAELEHSRSTRDGVDARMQELREELNEARFADAEHARQFAARLTEKFNAARDTSAPVL